MATSKEIRTDLGPMELGALVTAMGATHLETHRLDGRPVDRDGVSYLDIDWPVQPDGPHPLDGIDAAAQVEASGQAEADTGDRPSDPALEREPQDQQAAGRFIF